MRKIVFLAVVAVLVAGCGTYRTYTGTINLEDSPKNEITKSSALDKSLTNRSSLKFVLRLPEYYKDLPETEIQSYNITLAEIEKELIKRGHEVKDRKLLDVLLENNAMHSSDYSQSLDTDIINEIIDLQFDIPNEITAFKINEKNMNADFKAWQNLENINCPLAKLECKVILVDEGVIGGIFEIYISACEANKQFYISVYENLSGNIDTEKEAYVGWNPNRVIYSSLVNSYDMNESSRQIALHKLVGSLLNEIE